MHIVGTGYALMSCRIWQRWFVARAYMFGNAGNHEKEKV